MIWCSLMNFALTLHFFLSDALQTDVPPPPQIKQMLLVLQSVRRSPPADQFFQLQTLVGKVVKPYMYMVKHSRVGGRPPSEPPQEGEKYTSL